MHEEYENINNIALIRNNLRHIDVETRFDQIRGLQRSVTSYSHA